MRNLVLGFVFGVIVSGAGYAVAQYIDPYSGQPTPFPPAGVGQPMPGRPGQWIGPGGNATQFPQQPTHPFSGGGFAQPHPNPC